MLVGNGLFKAHAVGQDEVEIADINDIAGITNAGFNVLGMMPHPEDLTDAAHGGLDGLPLFQGVATNLMERAA